MKHNDIEKFVLQKDNILGNKRKEHRKDEPGPSKLALWRFHNTMQ
jgi:hypothetical protein